MLMRSTLPLLLCLFAATVWGAPAEFGIGDPAPPLALSEFIKGKPVKTFEKGKIYVVEFWATWCGPCVQSIPHVSELQKKHPEVTFIGVDVMEEDVDAVKDFVEEMGEKMDYRVAIEAPSEEGDSGQMSLTWLSASGQSGIPAAYIVNGDGVVAWMGHPMAMDDPLAEIVEGKWDVEAAKERIVKEKELAARMDKAKRQFLAAVKGGKYARAVEILDGVFEESPELEKNVFQFKLGSLLYGKDTMPEAEAYAETLATKTLADSAPHLARLGFMLSSPQEFFGGTFSGRAPKPTPKLLETALAAVRAADEMEESKSWMTAFMLARVELESGDREAAIKTQQRAIKLAEDEGRTEEAAELKKMLKDFEAPKKKPAPKSADSEEEATEPSEE